MIDERNLLFCRAVVQIAGRALACDTERLRELIEARPDIATLINSHEQTLFSQVQQSAACFSRHRLESRLARWLLRARDLQGSDEFTLTQEYLAGMLGVRRTSVSLVAHTLQTAGLISYRRGHIKLQNIEGLQETACECYQAVKSNYDVLLGNA